MTVQDFLYIKKLLEDERVSKQEHVKHLLKEDKENNDGKNSSRIYYEYEESIKELNSIYNHLMKAEVRV